MQSTSTKASLTTQPRNYTVKEACVALNISNAHFYKMVKDGRLRPIKLGRKTLVPIWQIDQIVGGGAA